MGALNAEDLIVEVDGKEVNGVDALKDSMDSIAQQKKEFVVMKVLRGIHTAYLELEPAWKKEAQ